MIKKIQMLIGAAASVYFAESDENKQKVIVALMAGHEMTKTDMPQDVSSFSVQKLADTISYFVDAEAGLTRSASMALAGMGYFETLNKAERTIAYVELMSQRDKTREYIHRLMEQLKTHF